MDSIPPRKYYHSLFNAYIDLICFRPQERDQGMSCLLTARRGVIDTPSYRLMSDCKENQKGTTKCELGTSIVRGSG